MKLRANGACGTLSRPKESMLQSSHGLQPVCEIYCVSHIFYFIYLILIYPIIHALVWDHGSNISVYNILKLALLGVLISLLNMRFGVQVSSTFHFSFINHVNFYEKYKDDFYNWTNKMYIWVIYQGNGPTKKK